MVNKRNPKLPKNDFAPEEDLDICAFSSNEKIPDTYIATFSINKLNTIISTKLGIIIDTDDSNKVA